MFGLYIVIPFKILVVLVMMEKDFMVMVTGDGAAGPGGPVDSTILRMFQNDYN